MFTAVALILLPTVTEAFGDWTLTNAVGQVRADAVEKMGLNPNSPRELSQVYGAYFWAFVALLVGLAAMLTGERNRRKANDKD